MSDWSEKKVAIIGAARQGLALARYLLTHGARVVITDRQPLDALAEARQSLADVPASAGRLEWVAGGHPLELLEGIDLLCPSGGAPLTLPIVQEAIRRGIPLSNDSQIFLEAAHCRVIGITGSAGKTTTTTLMGRMAIAGIADLPPAGDNPPSSINAMSRPPKAWVGGNIGTPLIGFVDEMEPDDLAVMELSSFQLEIMDRSPQVAAVLNVTPNHLDRHGTMEAYTAAKAHILQHQTRNDVAVLGRDDPGAWSLAGMMQGRLLSFGFSELPADAAGAYLYGDGIYLRAAPGADDVRVVNASEIGLRGMHNWLNVMAACTIAAAAGLRVAAMQAGVRGFTGVPHRLELVRRWGGAEWYNDSIATAPERAMAAVRAFEEPLVLLAGGRDKNLPWDEFAALILRRVDHLVVFGEAADIILRALERAGSRPAADLLQGRAPLEGGLQTVTRCASLKEAVAAASGLVQPGDVVLLSPGGTSFDEFKDFEERGKCFAQWVNELR
jgi:UDP-N-acetylmuramoylalanine--D-glutamate ligase